MQFRLTANIVKSCSFVLILQNQKVKCSENEIVYDLLATVGHVQDFKSGGNLVAHIHVGTTYHSRKEVRTLLVNDLFQSLSSLRYRLHYAGEILKTQLYFYG